MQLVILLVHIVGAMLTAVFVVLAGIALWYKKETFYLRDAIALAIMIFIQAISGTALYLLSNDMTFFALCKNFALYLTIPISLLILLVLRIRAARVTLKTESATQYI